MKSFFSRSSTPDVTAEEPRPDQPVYVVGDLHGRADLLEPILTEIDAHLGRSKVENPMLVFVGDYVDYGPDSRGVLMRLQEMQVELPQNVICLAGNHERMMLDFLQDPERRGARWMRAGGAETLQSYSISEPEKSPEAYRAAADALERSMGAGTLDWLKALPLSWSSGTVWVVHAAADPRHPMEAQSARVLLWGHPEFEAIPRNDGLWVAHGHQVVETAFVEEGRINVDTGAWKTGQLSAAAIMKDGRIDFLIASV